MTDFLGLDEDPYPVYARWHKLGPIVSGPMNHWFVVGHQVTMAALRDKRLVKPSEFIVADHARRRLLIQNALSSTTVDFFRPRTAELADTLITKAAGKSEVDVISDLASPLAISTAADVLGLPGSDQHVLAEWIRSFSGNLLPTMGHCGLMGGPITPPEEVAGILTAAIEFRRENPGMDVISQLINDASTDEIISLCIELLISAHDATVGLIGNGVKALLDNPGQYDRLRSDGGLITIAVEELLRYDSPVQYLGRRAATDAEIAGQALQAGESLLVMLGAANRDPDAFAAPDALDISRSPNHHVAFGRGGTLCLGAPLARMEGQVMIGALAARFGDLCPAGEPVRQFSPGGRTLTSLPIKLGESS